MTPLAMALLALGTGVLLLCSGKLLLPRDAFTRLHLLGAASTLGTGAIVLAVMLDEGVSPPAWKALLIQVLMLLYGPILNHATARAAWRRQRRLAGEPEP